MGYETHGRRYLRAKTEISSDKDGDISGQKRRYPPSKPYNGPTDKAHIGYNSANRLFIENDVKGEVIRFMFDRFVVSLLLLLFMVSKSEELNEL